MQKNTTMANGQSGQAHPVHTNPVNRPLTRARHGVAWLTLLLFTLPAAANAAGKADKCVAGICLEQPVTQKMLVAKYGPGLKRIGPGSYPDFVTRCYYDNKQGLYVEFTFDQHHELNTDYGSDLTEIMVSRTPMCPKRYAPKKPFARLATESGLAVGSTEAEVEAALGKPDRVDDVTRIEQDETSRANSKPEFLMRDYLSSAYGTTKRVYIPDPQDLLFNAFYINAGMVKSILVSVSE